VAELTEEQLDLFRQPNYAVVATLTAEGSPHMSVMCVDEEDGHPRFNTTFLSSARANLRRSATVE
jgi:general stress protein 26